MNRKKDSQLQSAKPKTAKPKTVAVKARIKGAPTKRLKNSLKDKTKVKPAPIVEAGYSLYSAASENSVTGDLDTCSEVLARLKERRKGNHIQQCIDRLASSDDSQQTDSHSNRLTIVIPTAFDQESIQSDTNAPFNQRLSSSTPDPEKALYHVDHGNSFQTVPERDNSGPVTKETVSSIITIGNQAIDIPASSSGVHLPFSYYDISANTGSGIQFGNHGNTDGFYKREIINSSSSGFIPTVNKYTEADIHGWMRRDSDIQTYQSYIPRESTGFVTDAKTQNNESGSKDDSKGHSSSSSGAKEISQLISKQAGAQSTSINSSGTDYVVLPWPQGGAGGTILPPGTPVFQLQNGLFQIRPANSQSQTNVKQGQIGQDKTPSPTQNDLEGSYLGVDAFQIPERDHGPDIHLVENKMSSLGIAQDTLSTITGTNSLHHTITPVSQRTSSVNITPRTQSSVNTENSRNVDCKIENLEKRFKVAEENIKEKEVNLNIDQNRKTAEIGSGHIRQKHDVSVHNSQGQNLSDLSDKNTESNVLNTQCSHTFTSHGQNVSGQSGQGQIFLIQTSQGTFATSNNSSSVQLVPVSLLPSSNFNSSVAMTTNQPETMRTGGQDAPQSQNTHMEAMKQTEPVDSSSVGKTHVNIPNPWSKVKMDAGLKKLKYLLGELKECGKIGKDVEVTRLVKDVEKTIEGIPTLSSKFNLMAEIDLCLQPLRNENCQLRRKLRLTNQQLKEKETVKEKAALDFDVLHLQASNTALQKQVAGEKETKVKLALELKDLHSQIQRMKIERNKLLAALSEKETDELKIKQECLSDTQKFRHEIEQLRQQTEGIEVKHEALEQENHILQITLQQRDAEIDKMQEVVNAVKECVASLIQELEESKTGDKSFISNNSFSIQKLLRVLGEDSIASFSQKNLQERNPEESYSQHKQYYVGKEPSTPRLTKQALASHNKSQTKGNTRFNSENDEELKSSRSDTEVELNVENYGKERRKSTPRRGQSLSPPHRRAPLRERNAAYVNTVSTRQRNHLSPDHRISPDDKDSNYKSINRSLSPTFQKNPRVAFDFSKTSYRHNSADFQRGSEVMSNVPQSCNQSEASRYSVTDYFKKYPKNQPSGVDSSRNRFHQRSYSQPDYNARHSNVHTTPNKSQQKQSGISSPHRANDGQAKRNLNAFSPQDNLYHGTCLDNSLSAITDDNISSVSERTVSTASTVNDMSFRRGIAALDANILKLQLALQKTKSMLS